MTTAFHGPNAPRIDIAPSWSGLASPVLSDLEAVSEKQFPSKRLATELISQMAEKLDALVAARAANEKRTD